MAGLPLRKPTAKSRHPKLSLTGQGPSTIISHGRLLQGLNVMGCGRKGPSTLSPQCIWAAHSDSWWGVWDQEREQEQRQDVWGWQVGRENSSYEVGAARVDGGTGLGTRETWRGFPWCHLQAGRSNVVQGPTRRLLSERGTVFLAKSLLPHQEHRRGGCI